MHGHFARKQQRNLACKLATLIKRCMPFVDIKVQMPICLCFVSCEIDIAFFAQHELSAVPKAFWVKAVVINNDIFDYVVFAEQIVGDDDFALQMLFNQRRSQSGIYPFKSVEKIPPAKGEFIDDFIAFDEIMIAHHFDE